MANDFWDYAVRKIRDELDRNGEIEAERVAYLWERNVAFDPAKLLKAARELPPAH